MAPSRSSLLLKRFYTAYTLAALVLYGLLLLVAFPWWFAVNHPVSLTLGAPAGARAELAFGDDGERVPIVPVGEVTPYHWYWGTELPARPRHTLSLHFPEGTGGEWVLAEVKLLTLSPERREHRLRLDFLDAAVTKGIRLRRLSNGWGIVAQPGTTLTLPDTLPPPSPGQWAGAFLIFTVTYVLISGMLLMMVALALRFPDGIRSRPHAIRPIGTAVLLAGVAMGAFAHLYLVAHSMPDYWPADSTSYAMKAVSLVTEFSYDTGTHEYELNRMPGYPAFMALVFFLFGWNLQAVTVVQGVLFSLAVLALALSLRRLVPGYLIGLVSAAALISPPAIWASRQIATESLFASVWLLSLAAFLYLWQRSGKARLHGWILFGLGATAAVAIRPNGILLFSLPGFLVIGTLWWACSFRGRDFWRMPLFWKTCGHVAIPAGMTLLFLVFWSWRNYESRGYPKPTDLTEVVWANAPFFAGLFDLRAARDEPETVWFVNERLNSGYWFHGWSLRKYRFRELTDQYRKIEDSSILELERELAAFNARSDALIPLRARLAGYARVASWGLFFPRIGAHTTDPLNQDYRVLVTFPQENRAQQVRNNLKWATRHVEQTIRLEEAHSNPWIHLYNRTLVPLYPWLYRALFLAAVFGLVLAILERKYLAALLLTPYLLNIFLNIYFLYIIGRYVQVLDASLWLAALAGLACSRPESLQEPTNETDRRCIPPIRPKRLLTRFANEPGTPQ